MPNQRKPNKMFYSILNQILKNSIAQRWVIVVGAILVTVWGVFSLTQMPLDVFPEFAPPQVDIQTEAAGTSSRRSRIPNYRPH